MVNGVDLYWIPLGAGAGGALVRWSGRIYETAMATVARRQRCDLYHAALEVTLHGTRTAIEMGPVWTGSGDRGVDCEGPVGARFLGRSQIFRYEVRCWREGSIPDLANAVGGPRRVSSEASTATSILELVNQFPTFTWGRDELQAGDMWNSNSLVAWLLACSGLQADDTGPPPGGRAPGWEAGLVAATRLV